LLPIAKAKVNRPPPEEQWLQKRTESPVEHSGKDRLVKQSEKLINTGASEKLINTGANDA
jgi:hypothetical protein